MVQQAFSQVDITFRLAHKVGSERMSEPVRGHSYPHFFSELAIHHALGRSRGGMTTKIHMLCDSNGVPLKFLLSGGQVSDIAHAHPLLDEAYIPSLRGRPRKRCRCLLADKSYDTEASRRYCDRYRMQPVIHLRSMKHKPKLGVAEAL